jgi:hypothetical protein
MKVWGIMIPEIHPDNDPKKSGNDGHDSLLSESGNQA